jgi:Mg2+-importing ATPase
VPAAALETLLRASAAPPELVMTALGTSIRGLPAETIRARREQFGSNEVARERLPTWYSLLIGNFRNPFILVLIALGIVSYETGDVEGTIVVACMVVVSVAMRFLQEYRSSRAAAALRAMVTTTATVTRQIPNGEPDVTAGVRCEVPFKDLVSGDIVHLSAGDMIPADVRLVSAKDLFVAQAALTGESMPVEKSEVASPETGVDGPPKSPLLRNPLERATLGFMGTTIVSGAAVGVVIATGPRTYFGSLAASLAGPRPLTSFDRGVNSVTWVLIRFMVVMVPVVFLLNGLLKHSWHDAFLFSVAVAVGLTPEMLPMVVTANLARGAVAMAREKVIVKRLNAIQNLGAMDVLCTDKTGTLTEDRVVLERHRDLQGRVSLRVLELAYLNSYYQTGLKNLLDRAVLEHVEVQHELNVLQHYAKIDEVPFDFDRRRMSVVVQNTPSEHVLICKGAVDEVFGACTMAETDEGVRPFDESRQAGARAIAAAFNADGFRVVAVASRALAAGPRTYGVGDERELVLAGFIAFLDPPKPGAADAIAALHRQGVRVVVLTGDNDIVTRRVCAQVGVSADWVVLGAELEPLDADELSRLSASASVFAKLSPSQKTRVVRSLQDAGHTVGFLGDGINDAPSLKQADVGISVDSATDIARESAEIILLEKSLLVLHVGVRRGREVYGNIIKYIKMTASSNFGNVFSVLIASAILPFLPMLPVQILIQNLLYDFSQLSLPWDRMDEDFLARPRTWDPSGIARFMVWIGPLSSIFDVTTFALLWFVFGASSPARQPLFQSGWFVEGLLSQTLIVHMIRTEKIPFVQSRAAVPVLLLTSGIMLAGVWLPFSTTGRAVGMVGLPSAFFPWLLATLLVYCAVTQTVKVRYIRRFGMWL